MAPQIILIGGTAGVGKTSLACRLRHMQNITHHLATGFVRETLRTVLSRDTHPELFHYTFQPPQPASLIPAFMAQSRLVCDAVHACIRRARDEGTSLVIEGNHLVPGLVDPSYVSLFVVLRAAPAELAMRLRGPTHTRRAITDQDVANVARIQEAICVEAERFHVPVLEHDDTEATLQQLLAIQHLAVCI